MRDDQRFWCVEPGPPPITLALTLTLTLTLTLARCVEPGPPPWFGADGKPRIFAMRHQTMAARAVVQREELERRRLREVENDGYFWTPTDK